MATGGKDAAFPSAKPVREQPGRSPQGPAPQPLPPPHPALEQAGFYGSPDEFNRKVPQIVQAYKAAHGVNPSPGLVLDVARSPVAEQQYHQLFDPAFLNPDVARAKKAVGLQQQQNPSQFLVKRPDGVEQPDSPLKNVGVPSSDYQKLLKKYPMVMEGGLPIPNMDKVFGALEFLNKPVGQPSDVISATVHQLRPDQAVVPPGQDVVQAEHDVKTVRQAQVELNKQMGTDLPVTGVMNDTWQQTLGNWTKSKDYFQKMVAFQAQQEGFGKNIPAYIKAWNSKQKAVRHGLYGQFLNAMPLRLFGHGGFWGSLEALPAYLKGSSNNPLNIGLHSLTRTAGLGLDTVGGTVEQAKADVAAGTTLAAYVAGLHGKSTYEDALDHARKQLHDNPSWMRILGLGFMPDRPSGFLNNVDQATNVVGDLVLLRKANFTGERVAAGDVAAASRSEYLRAASGWAYKDLVAHGLDGVGRASSRLEGGQGARELVARTARLVQRGDMTPEQFTNHVAELHATGRTTVDVGGKLAEIKGPVLSTLRTNKLPSPGVAGRGWLDAKRGMRSWLDGWENGTAKAPLESRAVGLATRLSAEVAHAASEGGRLGYFDTILPERTFNFVRKYELGDNVLANQLESKLVRFQGTENVRGIQQVQRQLEKLWHDKYPSKSAPKDEPFKAMLSSEMPSVFQFPGGGDARLTGALDSAAAKVSKVNAAFNKAAKIHARIILSGANLLTGVGGFSLFWKHTVGDGLRALVAGSADLLNPDVRQALKRIDGLANSDPEMSRRLGAFYDRGRMGETRWALGKGGQHVFTESFDTADHFPRGVFGKKNYMQAAGGYLRRHLDAAELDGYRNGNLVDVILRNREARAAWKSRRAQVSDLTAEQHANDLTDEFRNIETALSNAGLSWEDALKVLRESRGHEADSALGEFIRKHQLDFHVRGGQVEQANVFDELTSRWVGNVVMRPNKMWRTTVAKATLGRYFHELTAAGFDDKTALSVAQDVSERILKYHMLDFANRLQVEQDLRWLSYFATKHRLYWKWVTGQFLRNPRYAAAVDDFRKTLNKSGGISLPFNLLGTRWQVPLERLVWVPGHEYDETSPLASAIFSYIKSGGNLDSVVQNAVGTQGNVLTRSDSAMQLGGKLLNIELGHTPATYGAAVAGLNRKIASKVRRAINEYQDEFYKTHGRYAPESEVVKIALLQQMGLEYQRANLPLPVVPESSSDGQEKLLNEFMTILEPRKRAQFLNDHPGFSDHFGVYQDPKIRLHNEPFFERWTKALDAFRAGRADLFAQAKRTGEWTPEMEKQRRDLSAALERTRNQLLVEDAQQSGVQTNGLVPDGSTVPYGSWGKLVNKSPLFDLNHFLSGLFPNLKTDGHVIGPLQQRMQQELSQLNDPKYVQSSNYTPEEVKTRKRELLQGLQVFRDYPSDATAALQSAYQTRYVNKYWSLYDGWVERIKAAPTGQRKVLDAQFRAWRDSQDKKVLVDGVRFPAPLRMAWALLDPQTRQDRLSYLASKDVQSLADYELDLLGVEHPKGVSDIWAQMQQRIDEFHRKYPGESVSKDQIRQWAKLVDRVEPGFARFYSRVVDQPRVVQFEQTSLYKDMPADVRTDLGPVFKYAAGVAADIRSSGNSGYYKQEWANMVDDHIRPWLEMPAQAQVRAWLAPFGPNFLYELVS